MHVSALLTALPWLLFCAMAALFLRRRPQLKAHSPAPGDDPLISIIVPARNEALNIGTCIESLVESTCTNREIIVVDDGSTDATGEIARQLARPGSGVTVINTEPLPPGWVGKPWACWTGYQKASGSVLLFTDADTRHAPELLAHAMAASRETGAGLVSVFPRQRMETFWEVLILPHIFLAIQLGIGPLSFVNRTRNPRRVIANGQFMLFRRDVYERIGGHAAIQGEIVEDLVLAQRVVAAGERLYLVHAHEMMETRMYRSLPEILEGWTKNLARGASLALPPRLGTLMLYAGAAAGLLFWAAPPVIFAAGFLSDTLAPMRAWAAITTAISTAFWIGAALYQKTRVGPALLYPLGAAISSFLMVRSAARGNRVKWRGREYELVNP